MLFLTDLKKKEEVSPFDRIYGFLSLLFFITLFLEYIWNPGVNVVVIYKFHSALCILFIDHKFIFRKGMQNISREN